MIHLFSLYSVLKEKKDNIGGKSHYKYMEEILVSYKNDLWVVEHSTFIS